MQGITGQAESNLTESLAPVQDVSQEKRVQSWLAKQVESVGGRICGMSLGDSRPRT